jgi:type II secretory pathway pseudopilin PulG
MSKESLPGPEARDAGLTIVELIVAMAILAMGAVAIISVLVQAHKTNAYSHAKTMAVNAAEEQLEQIFNAPAANVLDFNNQTFLVGDLTRPGGQPPGLITVGAGDPHPVTVDVVWEGRGTVAAGRVTITALRSEAER